MKTIEMIKHAEFIGKCKEVVDEKKPQLTAIASTGCFLGAIFCATQEAPVVNKAIENKRKVNPTMTKLEEFAVAAPKYAKTLILTGLGVGLNIAAWKFEAVKTAATLAALSKYASENSNLREAAERVVGEDKANQINEEARHIEETSKAGKDADTDLPADRRYVPIKLKLIGQSRYMSKREMLKRLEQCVDYMALHGYIEEAVLIDMLGYDADCDLIDLDNNRIWLGQMGSKERAREALDWLFEPDEDEYGRLGYILHLAQPERNYVD